MPVNVRLAIPEDIPHLMDLERLAPTAARWSEKQYQHAIGRVGDLPERVVLIAEWGDLLRTKVNTPALSPQQARRQGLGTRESNDKIPVQAEQGRGTPVGFLVATHVEREWELENIVVGPELRGRDIGTQLIDALLARVRAENGSAIFLEVRESNAAARKLYEKAGFRETGRRKLYYSHPDEDAVLYCKNVV
jgi:ribosomal-protein-alanine acetyltransferase